MPAPPGHRCDQTSLPARPQGATFTGQPAACSRYTAVTLNKPLDFERGGEFFYPHLQRIHQTTRVFGGVDLVEDGALAAEAGAEAGEAGEAGAEAGEEASSGWRAAKEGETPTNYWTKARAAKFRSRGGMGVFAGGPRMWSMVRMMIQTSMSFWREVNDRDQCNFE
jgi:hypothetical protein